MWTRIFPMLPIFAEGIIAFMFGIYQLTSGKESFLMCGYRKKYNYEKNREKFVKMCGVLDLSLGIILAVLLPVLYVKVSLGKIIFIFIQLLCAIGIGRHVMLCLFTDNL